MPGLSKRQEAQDKWACIERGITRGYLEGKLHGRVPLLSPLIGAIGGYLKTVKKLLLEDFNG